jgi:A/G-specific adenine glycosylase
MHSSKAWPTTSARRSRTEPSLAARFTREAMADFRRRVFNWGRTNRRDFFWRNDELSPFAMLVTEVLLTRTRADAVVQVLGRLLSSFPSAAAMADASENELEHIVYPLGLFRKRSRGLIALARQLEAVHQGNVPMELQQLLILPQVGRYAANAVLCFAFGERRAVVDANVARLFARAFGLEPPRGKLDSADEYWKVADGLLPRRNAKLFNWSLLDLGARVCTPGIPRCARCPIRILCVAHRTSRCGCGDRLRKTNRGVRHDSDSATKIRVPIGSLPASAL